MESGDNKKPEANIKPQADQFGAKGDEPSFIRRAIANVKEKAKAKSVAWGFSHLGIPLSGEGSAKAQELQPLSDQGGTFKNEGSYRRRKTRERFLKISNEFIEQQKMEGGPIRHDAKLDLSGRTDYEGGSFGKWIWLAAIVVVVLGGLKIRDSYLSGSLSAQNPGVKTNKFDSSASPVFNRAFLRYTEKEIAQALAEEERNTPAYSDGSTAQNTVSAPEQVDVTWWKFLRCATSSIWSGYHSKFFQKLNDDYAMMFYKQNMYVFTPFFAGKQKVFSGLYWEKYFYKPMLSITSSKEDWRSYRYYKMPYLMHKSREQIPGFYVIGIMRDDTFVREKGGRPLFVASNDQTPVETSQVESEWPESVQNFWQVSGKVSEQLSPKAKILLMREVEMQMKKFQAHNDRINELPSSRFGANLSRGRQLSILSMCQDSAKAYGNLVIENVAQTQKLKLRRVPANNK